MKFKQNGQWKNLGGIDPTKFGNYILLTPDMVSEDIGTSTQRYIGTATHLIIDDSFPTNNLSNLFFGGNKTITSLVILTDKFIGFRSLFNGVGTQLKNIFINTSNVTDMSYMFQSSQVTTLDLSSFDTSKVTDMSFMFQYSQATTGYARTQADADRFNAGLGKPTGLTFVVKP